MENLHTFIKEARIKKGLMVREVAHALQIDQALVSKFESGSRKPTRSQLHQLAEILSVDESKLKMLYLSAKILYELAHEDDALEILKMAEEQIQYQATPKNKIEKQDDELKSFLKGIDVSKKKLNKFRKFDSYRIAQALELEYTFESNRIEGNTLTLRETDLVINEGLTISGKSMREHLEAINHAEAVELVKDVVQKKIAFTERILLQLHHLVLKSIDAANAGKYRSVQVMIKGSKHLPPQPILVPKQMEDYFIWYNKNKKVMHPVLLAAEMHERLVTIHPFIDGNGRTSRLVMNLILLQHGYVIANIKGDRANRMAYYEALEIAQTENSKSKFLKFVADTELNSLNNYLKVVGGK
jgi:fido (protein-threonine AMPylation protein)/transcriptional regulator with XRE-family HTH domain